jgi:hypothetical protein
MNSRNIRGASIAVTPWAWGFLVSARLFGLGGTIVILVVLLVKHKYLLL